MVEVLTLMSFLSRESRNELQAQMSTVKSVTMYIMNFVEKAFAYID
jgi:hypothetical protein